MSLAEIVEEADKIAWNPQIPLKYWVGALEALYREASSVGHRTSCAERP